MAFGTSVSFSNAAKLSAAAILLFASAAPLTAQDTDKFPLAYLASFPNGSLEPVLDLPDFGEMHEGHSQIADTFPDWIPDGGDLILEITRPVTPVIGVVSAGVFVTQLDFGPGTVFKAQATYFKPDGPHATGDIWVTGITARTGDINDLAGETRVGVTLQVRGTSIRLNAQGSGVPGEDLPPEVYDAIFSLTDPKPYTLELVVNRNGGTSRVNLKVNDREYPRDVTFPTFPAGSGPTITAIGPVVVNANAPGQTASVHLREFRMFLPSDSEINTAATCGDTWNDFSCREVPTDQ